jgi:exopolysaccharide biosynthesis polyprenyl glycosylphosphotransferase
MARQFSLRFTLFLFFSDLALALLALVLATQARYAIPLGREIGPIPETGVPLPVYALTVAVWAGIFLLLDTYNPREISVLGRELIKVVEAGLLAWLALAGMLYFSYRDVSRLLFVYFLGINVLLVISHRIVLRLGFLSHNGHRYHTRRVLIVGTGELAASIGELVHDHAWMGLVLDGFVGAQQDARTHGGAILGTLDDTVRVVEQRRINEVVIALPRDEVGGIRELIDKLQALPVNIRLVPDYLDLVFLRLDFENFSGMPLLSLKEPVLDPFQRLIKRAFDLMVAGITLGPALPIMGLIALAIRLDSPGPVLFRQKRVGEGGRVFTMFKFRTMTADAEALQAQHNHVDEEGNVIHKHKADPRVTRVGCFLRRASLDELPQLFNIIRGEMSLVGPRPEMPWLVDLYKPWQRKRFEVPQGLTGWWQINGRSDKPMHLHTEEDLYYIQHYSLLLDIKILFKTFGAVWRKRGAF